jgi:hypothetical protein
MSNLSGRKTGKTGSLKLSEVTARNLMTGIGSCQSAMNTQGAQRSARVVAAGIAPGQGAFIDGGLKAARGKDQGTDPARVGPTHSG